MWFSEVQGESTEESPSLEGGQNSDMQKEKEKGKGRGQGNHRITESQNSRGWKGPLWVI